MESLEPIYLKAHAAGLTKSRRGFMRQYLPHNASALFRCRPSTKTLLRLGKIMMLHGHHVLASEIYGHMNESVESVKKGEK